jgi:hypothetical protein
MFIPDPGSGFFSIPDPGSRGSKKHRIPGLDLQHCFPDPPKLKSGPQFDSVSATPELTDTH